MTHLEAAPSSSIATGSGSQPGTGNAPHFHNNFKPAAEKFDGFIDLKMVKIRKVIHGGPPPAASINYRFQLTYQSEEKRQVWIASEVHGKVWPLIENTLTDKGYLVLLTDSM